ncbi:hypothetical protein [Halomarina rubra]|uniref:Uncharacterized protein n=1 Tax=Halomarina rubra TaxID=2071873 RepID=A0ABD6B1V2_9EURY|nr:hypothetical protein [Halomarina rubra]
MSTKKQRPFDGLVGAAALAREDEEWETAENALCEALARVRREKAEASRGGSQ